MTRLMLGDNIESLKQLEDNSIDSLVTDGPYGLSFMSKKWDYDVPSVKFWQEAFRVLKPGGHVLSFGGTRTYHRMVVNIEDAGFEIRDQIQWLYGSGFPKSHNIGKSVDKMKGNEREVVGVKKGAGTNKFTDGVNGLKPEYENTKGASEWEGWGTALKPANEPICLARKPLSEKTIADNVLRWGTGGINIDGCRIKIEGKDDRSAGIRTATFGSTEYIPGGNDTEPYVPNEEGRFPANLILDEEAGAAMDEQTGILQSGKMFAGQKTKGYDGPCMGNFPPSKTLSDTYGDKGGASRFFYQAKVSKKERNLGLDAFNAKTDGSKGHGLDRKCSYCNTSMLKPEECKCEEPNWIIPAKKNFHPTVKPVSLMAYLCRLITPPNGIVLDPFMGSGSTGIAANLEGFSFIGMEMDEDYFKIAEARIEDYKEYAQFNKNK